MEVARFAQISSDERIAIAWACSTVEAIVNPRRYTSHANQISVLTMDTSRIESSQKSVTLPL